MTLIGAAEEGDFWGLPFAPHQIPSTSKGDGVPEGKPCIHTLPLYFSLCSFTGQQLGWEQGCTAKCVSRAVSADGLGVLWPWYKGPATIPTCALGPRGCADQPWCPAALGDSSATPCLWGLALEQLIQRQNIPTPSALSKLGQKQVYGRL